MNVPNQDPPQDAHGDDVAPVRQDDNGNNGANGAGGAALVAPRRARIIGDWTDDRTPATNPFFPPWRGRKAVRADAANAAGYGGRQQTTAITYGNLQDEATAFLNAADGAPHNFATRVVSRFGLTTISILCLIVQTTSKINIVARVIMVLVYGIGTTIDSIDAAQREDSTSVAARLARYAVDFFATRLNSSRFDMDIRATQYKGAKWSNWLKAIRRRAGQGVWGNGYCRAHIRDKSVVNSDYQVTQGVFFPVALYCNKLIPSFVDTVGTWYVTNAEGRSPAWTAFSETVFYNVAVGEDDDSIYGADEGGGDEDDE
ncbi:MAG: hypothetical protein SGARI_000076 [Bacillariaceae sp.]